MCEELTEARPKMTDFGSEDSMFMRHALSLARRAMRMGEIPVGAIVVENGVAGPRIIGRGFNYREKRNDPTAHAEVMALRAAGRHRKSWQLTDCRMYVTLEPCPMCAGALVNARIRRLIFGAYDPKAGACGTLYQITNDRRLNHRMETTGGLMAEDSAALLREFFTARRKSGLAGVAACQEARSRGAKK
jgi:tRNA(adenine34) deaminase